MILSILTPLKYRQIFVDGVDNIKSLNISLNEIAPDRYTIKALNSENVKIPTTGGQIYTNIIKALEVKTPNAIFINKHKGERSFHVVL